MSSTPCLDFLAGRIPTNKGNYVTEMLYWSNDQWEECHDHIQWCFPTKEQSKFNLNCPLLTDTEVSLFKEYKQEKNHFVVSNFVAISKRFLEFLHIEYKKIGGFWDDWSFDFKEQKLPEHLADFNHNYLRITRFITCLRYFGYSAEAEEVMECLTDYLGCQHSSYEFWVKAAYGPLA